MAPAWLGAHLVQNPGVSRQSYDASGDPLSGIVTSNGREVEPGGAQGESVSADGRFVQAFGQGNEADDEQEQRCRIESALKAFLSHWLVGGEMPPKTEI